jgi:uncharacterized DUF497 family protein
MKIVDFVWLDQFTEKLETKHGVYPDEVKAVFAHQPKIRRLEKGHVRGEDFYRALGQTSSGRYLAVFFIYKPLTRSALVISSRDMTYKERKSYHE